MPPKQVYGRRTTAKTATTFSKFISPDKDLPVGEPRKNALKPKPAPVKDELEVMRDELVRLALGDDQETVISENVEEAVQKAVKKKVGRPRKNGGKKTTIEVEVVDLAGQLNALKMNESEIETQKERQQEEKRRSRKILESTDDVAATKEQTIVPQNHPDRQSPTPSAPMRGRKLQAVLIPKRRSSPAMPPSLPTPELTPDVTPEPDDVYTSHVSSLLSQSYGKKIISFEEWSSALEPHFEVSKIAEASFSEVYRLSAASPTSDSSNESVLKLVALKPPANAPLSSQSQGRKVKGLARRAKNDRTAWEAKDLWKSHVEDVHSEVKLLQNLNDIPGFTNFREVTVLQGRPTTTFANAWKTWNKTRPKKKKSDFPDPSKKTSYEDTQLWAVVEMQDAGTDCEKVMEAGGISTVWEVWDVFWGVCLGVAKAEEACKFEHRDLHLENICIRSSRSHTEDDLTRPFIKDPLRRKLGFTGLDTTVIDYTLSRADVSASDSSKKRTSLLTPKPDVSSCDATASSIETEVAYLDLNKDMGLFSGDASEEYQYEIYRYMRGAVFYDDPLKNSPPNPNASYNVDNTLRRSPRKTAQNITFDSDGYAPEPSKPRRSPRKSMTGLYCDPPSDIWKAFHPKTNLVWAHFILFKLLENLEGGEPTALAPKQVMRNVEAKPEETAKVVKKASRLFKVLERVSEMLEPRVLGKNGSLGGMKELVVLALEERWLRVEDVSGV